MSPFPFFSRLRSSCFPFSGVVVLSLTAFAPTQAQSPTFNVAEYAEYNAKIDDAAASFAADVARRYGAAPVRDADRSTPTSRLVQNTPTRQNAPNAPISTSRRAAVGSTPANVRPTDASKSQAARIWEAFLFGTPNRPVSTPKFAFAQRGAARQARLSRSTSSAQPSQTAQTVQTAQSFQSLQSSQEVAPPSDAELAAARRRRLQELNALLATRRPEEFSRRIALKNAASARPEPTVASVDGENNEYAENAESFAADAPALPFLLAEPVADRPTAVLQDRAEFAPFDAARANRSKIRQASNLEPAESPQPLSLADDGFASFLLPTRPNALRLSPNVFLSTDLVRLPTAAPLAEAAENAQTSPTAQTPQPLQTPSNAEPSRSTSASRPVQPLQTAQTPATVATPLPAEPSTDVPTLRPTARFVEPRYLPTSR